MRFLSDVVEGHIGGYSEPQYSEKNRKIPQYSVENSMNIETAWMDKTEYRTEAAKLPKYRNTENPNFPLVVKRFEFHYAIIYCRKTLFF